MITHKSLSRRICAFRGIHAACAVVATNTIAPLHHRITPASDPCAQLITTMAMPNTTNDNTDVLRGNGLPHSLLTPIIHPIPIPEQV